MKKWLTFAAALSLIATSMSCVPSSPGDEAVNLAKQDLVGRLGVAEKEISLVMLDEVDWPDTSLGVPESGKMYAQVITPGYRITLSAKGENYTYHAGKLGGKMTVIAAPR